MNKTNDKDRYTLRMPHKYMDAIKAEAQAIGTSMSAVILRIFAQHYGYLANEEQKHETTN